MYEHHGRSYHCFQVARKPTERCSGFMFPPLTAKKSADICTYLYQSHHHKQKVLKSFSLYYFDGLCVLGKLI